MTTVSSYTTREYERDLRRVYESVFDVTIPYEQGPAFSSRISVRALLYPIKPELEPVELEALTKAARAVGDSELYLSLLWPMLDPDAVNHWRISLENPANYYSLRAENKVLPNALYSPAGKWGIMITDAFYAGVGGSDVFVKTLLNNLPISAEEQLQACIAAYKSELTSNRFGGPPLRNFLVHLYGKARTQQILAEAGILT